ncbi:MAG: nitroreductase family protein [Verrucomicrobiota bacterium]
MPSKAEILDKIIRARFTEKVVREVAHQQEVPPELEAVHRQTVLGALETAGWAPFHYPRESDELAEPWRAHVLWSQQARRAASFLEDQLEVTSKEPKLAAACSALVLVTWIPEVVNESANQSVQEKINLRNEEHLAATSAMVQNFLLLLTAHDLGNYWSSGGKFRSAEMAEYLNVPVGERLLAAVFIEYPEMRLRDDGQTLRQPGTHRDKRSTGWIREVSV